MDKDNEAEFVELFLSKIAHEALAESGMQYTGAEHVELIAQLKREFAVPIKTLLPLCRSLEKKGELAKIDWRGIVRSGGVQWEMAYKAAQNIVHKRSVSIDIDTIELIHGRERHQDGYIAFCRHVNAGHQDLAGIRVGELRQYLPRLVEWLLTDSYFTVNAGFRNWPKWKNRVTGLPHPYRPDSSVRYLNALYVDCDIYNGKPPMSWPEAAAAVFKAQDEKRIPHYSLIVRSGRGMYLLWLLKSERPGVYGRAMPQEIALYKTLSEKFHDVLNAYEPRLVADTSQQKRLLGLLRVPGSIHSKAGLPVIANLQSVAGVGVPVYTLAELAGFFNVPLMPTLPKRERALYLSGSGKPVKRPGSCPARRRGRIVTAERRLQDLSGISQVHNGIEQGKRYVSLWYLCEFSKASGRSMGDTQELAEKFAATCRPPYPSDAADVPVSDIIKRVWVEPSKCRRFKSESLAKFFAVTPELAGELNLQSIIPEATRQARRAAPGLRAQARAVRRGIIKAMLAEHPGRVPSVRQVQARLPETAGFSTISADIKAMRRRHRPNTTKPNKDGPA